MNKIWNDVAGEFEELSMEEQEQEATRIIEAAKKSGVIIDTHNDSNRPRNMKKENIVLAKYYRYSVTKTGKAKKVSVDVVPLFTKTLCCINPLGLGKDGKVYLSPWSIGGNVVRADVDTFNKEHTVEYLKTYGHPVLSCWLGRLELV